MSNKVLSLENRKISRKLLSKSPLTLQLGKRSLFGRFVVYVIRGVKDKVLYVGRSSIGLSRVFTSASVVSKREKISSIQVFRVKTTSKRKFYRCERYLIEKLKPKYNGVSGRTLFQNIGDWKAILKERKRIGVPVYPSVSAIPSTISCPTCEAPYTYIRLITVRKSYTVSTCQICNSRFNSPYYTKGASRTPILQPHKVS